MPGIFLSTIHKEEKGPQIEPKQKWKKLLLLLIPCFFILLKWKSPQPQLFDLPTKHPDFIGREKELIQLNRNLFAKQKARGIPFVTLWGEGGIGKTELAIAFANDHLKKYSLICWIDGSSPESIHYSYSRLGDFFHISETDPKQLQIKVHQALSRNKKKPWLLIFDDLRKIPPQLPQSGGAILATCRDKSISPPESILELKKNPEEMLTLLKKLTGKKKSDALRNLVVQLDNLPFMVNLIGHYIAQTPEVNISDFLKHFDQCFLEKPEFRKRHPLSLSKTHKVTLEILKQKEPLCIEFLESVAYLHPNSIPTEFLLRWLEEKKKYTPEKLTFVKGDILRELQNCSLIHINEKTGDFTIHQLLHPILKKDNALKSLHVLAKVSAIKEYNPTQKETIRPFQKLLPHCIAILDDLTTPDLTATRLCLTVARYFLDTAHDLQKAKTYIACAKKWSSEWNHPIQGRIAFMAGVLHYREKNYEEALTFFETALSHFQKYNDPEQYQSIEQNSSKCTQAYQIAISMQYCAQMKRILGKWEEAKREYDLALETFIAITGEKEHFDIARILREQGILLAKRGDYEKAIEKTKAALSMQKRVYGKTYSSQPSVAATYRVLGDHYLQLQEYKKADEAYRKAIEINQKAYQTKTHPYIELLHAKRSKIKTLIQNGHL